MNRQLVSNVGWLSIDRLVRAVAGLAVSIMVARYLGPERLGLLNYAIALVYFFQFFADLGLQQIVVRELKNRPESGAEILATAFVLKIFGAIAGTALAALAAQVSGFGGAEVALMVLILAGGFFFQSANVVDYDFQAQINSRPMALARNAAFLAAAGLKLWFISSGKPVTWFAAAATIELALAAAFMYLPFRNKGRTLSPSLFDRSIARSLLRSSWPLALSLLLISIHTRVDQVMLGNLMSSNEVGWYGIAVRFTEFWYFIPLALVSTLTPWFVEQRRNDPVLYRAGLLRLYSAMFWFGVLLSVTVVLIGEPLIVLLMGEEFRPSAGALLIMIWSVIFVAQGMARGIWLVSEDLQRFRLYSNSLAVMLNIAGNFLLIPRMGIAGAAIATLATQGLSLWLITLAWAPIRRSTLDLVRSVNPAYMFRSS